MMSDKALVKHLQKEVARLESELKAPGSTCDHGPLLRKKDMHIEKVLTIFLTKYYCTLCTLIIRAVCILTS